MKKTWSQMDNAGLGSNRLVLTCLTWGDNVSLEWKGEVWPIIMDHSDKSTTIWGHKTK